MSAEGVVGHIALVTPTGPGCRETLPTFVDQMVWSDLKHPVFYEPSVLQVPVGFHWKSCRRKSPVKRIRCHHTAL